MTAEKVYDGRGILFCERNAAQNFSAVLAADSPAEHVEILSGDIYRIPVDRCKTAYNAFTRRFFSVKIVFGETESGQFDKTVRIDEVGNIFAHRFSCG